jgi:hypothetical protein
MNARTKVLVLAALAIALAVPPTAAQAKPNGRIVRGTSIGGVNIGLRRGPLFGRHHRQLRSVASILGKPQKLHSVLGDQTDAFAESVYVGEYTDDGIAVYYRTLNSKGKADKKRDASDKIIGVVTYDPKYQGSPSVGDLYPAADAHCAPADKRVAPDEGPRRVVACDVEAGGLTPGEDIAYMRINGASRAAQTVSQYAIFANLIHALLFRDIVNGALIDLGCDDFVCSEAG